MGRPPGREHNVTITFRCPKKLRDTFQNWTDVVGEKASDLYRSFMEKAPKGEFDTPLGIKTPLGPTGTPSAGEGGTDDVDAKALQQVDDNSRAISNLEDGQKNLEDGQKKLEEGQKNTDGILDDLRHDIRSLRELLSSAINGPNPPPESGGDEK